MTDSSPHGTPIDCSCAVCGAAFQRVIGKAGRRRIYCSTECSDKAYRDRVSARNQERRRAVALNCDRCGAALVQPLRGRVKRYCGTECWQKATGAVRSEPYPEAVCALAECDVVFTPFTRLQRCCSEKHGKLLYNRESRADGRQAAAPWSDARRERWHRRRALKAGASVGEPVLLAEIAERDGWLCGLCGEPVDRDAVWPDPMHPSVDHVVPLSRGGEHGVGNVQLAHGRCNAAKGNRV